MHPKIIESNTSQYRSYTLKLTGTVDDDFVNSFCPAETVVVHADDTTTISKIHTDQSGIIGLIRNLHNLGFIILSMNCCQTDPDVQTQPLAASRATRQLRKRAIK